MKRVVVLCLLGGLFGSTFAAPRSENLTAEYLNSEQAMREDEYANSLARRDWLRNRLVLQVGTGSKVGSYGEPGMFKNYGIGAEYIFSIPVGRVFIHPAVFAGYSWLPQQVDMAWEGIDDVEENFPLEGGTAYRMGLSFYFFPKLPLHAVLSFSYGDAAYYDHEKTDDANRANVLDPAEGIDQMRGLIKASGYNIDLAVVALTDSWYYLSFNIGFSFTSKAGTELGFEDPDENGKNPSMYRISNNDVVSRVINTKGIERINPSIGLTIGFALPELFPDDTEVRRRERERARAKYAL